MQASSKASSMVASKLELKETLLPSCSVGGRLSLLQIGIDSIKMGLNVSSSLYTSHSIFGGADNFPSPVHPHFNTLRQEPL